MEKEFLRKMWENANKMNYETFFDWLIDIYGIKEMSPEEVADVLEDDNHHNQRKKVFFID